MNCAGCGDPTRIRIGVGGKQVPVCESCLEAAADFARWVSTKRDTTALRRNARLVEKKEQ